MSSAFFQCEKISASLSMETCALRHRNKTCQICAQCETGAENAGTALLEVIPKLCRRCGKTGVRMIGKSLCVSCYNREREVVLGKDRNGHKPRLQLCAVEYAVTGNNVVRIMAASIVEIFADAYLGGYAFFCWASHPVTPVWPNPHWGNGV